VRLGITQVEVDHPELKHFENLWPVRAIMKQYLKNSSDKACSRDKCQSAHLGTEAKLMKCKKSGSKAHTKGKSKNHTKKGQLQLQVQSLSTETALTNQKGGEKVSGSTKELE
jgi:hypothetical protein